jgi:hypothetical protein
MLPPENPERNVIAASRLPKRGPLTVMVDI